MDGVSDKTGTETGTRRREAIAAEIDRLQIVWQIVQARIDLYAGQPDMADQLLPLIIEGDRLSVMIEQLERAKEAPPAGPPPAH